MKYLMIGIVALMGGALAAQGPPIGQPGTPGIAVGEARNDSVAVTVSWAPAQRAEWYRVEVGNDAGDWVVHRDPATTPTTLTVPLGAGDEPAWACVTAYRQHPSQGPRAGEPRCEAWTVPSGWQDPGSPGSVTVVVGEPGPEPEPEPEPDPEPEPEPEPPITDARISDDFGHYRDRAHLLNTGASDNPWQAMNQHDALVPGQFVFLDRNPPAGSLNGVTMRYDHGSVPTCAQNRLDTGGGARANFPDHPRELWVDFRIYLDGWTSSACGFFGYKLFFFRGPFGNNYGRADLNWVNQGMQGSGGPGAHNVFTGGSSTKPGFSSFVGVWTRVRWHVRLPTVPGGSDGVFRLWIDDEMVADLPNTSSLQYFDGITVGANLNNLTLQPMTTHWDYIRVYDRNPGW